MLDFKLSSRAGRARDLQGPSGAAIVAVELKGSGLGGHWVNTTAVARALRGHGGEASLAAEVARRVAQLKPAAYDRHRLNRTARLTAQAEPLW